MAALPRILQKIFGSSGAADQFGQIGSEAAGAATTTKDLATIQSLAQYLSGLYAITANLNEPPRGQDLNGLYLLITSQLAYLMQAGIPEYEAGTNYYADKSICLSAGIIYKCILGSDATPNINHTPASSPTYWAPFAEAADILTKLKTVDGNGSGLDTDLVRGTTPGAGGLAALAKAVTIWASDNDGPGSGLDADTVSGFGIGVNDGVFTSADLDTLHTGGFFEVEYNASYHFPVAVGGSHSLKVLPLSPTWSMQELTMLSSFPTGRRKFERQCLAGAWSPWVEVYTSGTDGAGSGLDADLLDGQHGAYYSNGGLHFVVLELGTWNMDTTEFITITHGLDGTKIRNTSVMIRNDSGTLYTLSDTHSVDNLVDGSVGTIGATTLNVSRRAGGFFDGALYDSVVNRGWITIGYVD